MSAAVTGPMPSIVSSCSTVAVPRLIGPSSALQAHRGAAPPGPALRHHHLLAVGQARGPVDRFQQRLRAGAAGPLRSRPSTRLPAGSR